MSVKLVNIESIGSYFESLSDPRHLRNRKHLLEDIIVISVCGMICGSDGPTGIHRWAKGSCKNNLTNLAFTDFRKSVIYPAWQT